MKYLLKPVVRKMPRSLWAALYPLVAPVIAPREIYLGEEYQGGRSGVFNKIHKENLWHDDESVSGSGSTLAQTENLRMQLEELFRRFNVNSILDAPCGDYNWMGHVNLPAGCVYSGYDIVPGLINDLKNAFPETTWGVLDIVKDDIPTADLWICRDVLFHLTLEDSVKVLANFANSEVDYFLCKNFDFVNDNIDVNTGGFRYINLRKPPFNLPKPITRLYDFYPPAPPAYMDLWTRKQVENALR